MLASPGSGALDSGNGSLTRNWESPTRSTECISFPPISSLLTTVAPNALA